MEKLIINIKNRKDSRLIKELLSRLDVEIENNTVARKQGLSKSKIKSMAELKKMGGIAKGQLISKSHLRNQAWKKRV